MTALAERVATLVTSEESEKQGDLTKREREVLRLLSQGRSNRQIGDELHASPHTIANHVRAILAKTGAANRTEAAGWAHRHNSI